MVGKEPSLRPRPAQGLAQVLWACPDLVDRRTRPGSRAHPGPSRAACPAGHPWHPQDRGTSSCRTGRLGPDAVRVTSRAPGCLPSELVREAVGQPGPASTLSTLRVPPKLSICQLYAVVRRDAREVSLRERARSRDVEQALLRKTPDRVTLRSTTRMRPARRACSDQSLNAAAMTLTPASMTAQLAPAWNG